jgi:predicted nuclease of predicted toxin-antitoxin system
VTERLLLDEHYSPAIAQALRDRGFDVAAVNGDAELMAKSDADLVSVAVAQDRRIVTENVKDFLPLADTAYLEGRPAPRLLLVAAHRFPRGRDRVGHLVTALDGWLRQPETPARPDQDWLA